MIKYLGSISNIFVIALVIGAVFVKMKEDGGEAIFRGTDLYILAGALLALVVLRIFSKKRKQ
jgi:hypothetical protein